MIKIVILLRSKREDILDLYIERCKISEQCYEFVGVVVVVVVVDVVKVLYTIVMDLLHLRYHHQQSNWWLVKFCD